MRYVITSIEFRAEVICQILYLCAHAKQIEIFIARCHWGIAALIIVQQIQ